MNAETLGLNESIARWNHERSNANRIIHEIRQDAVLLLNEYGEDRKISGVKGTAIMVASRIHKVSEGDPRMRRVLDVVLPPDTARGEVSPIKVSISTSGIGAPESSRINIKTDGEWAGDLHGANVESLLSDKYISLDRDGVGDVRYDVLIGPRVESLIPLNRAIRCQYIIGRLRTHLTTFPSRAT